LIRKLSGGLRCLLIGAIQGRRIGAIQLRRSERAFQENRNNQSTQRHSGIFDSD
jgi:hypothetical protein